MGGVDRTEWASLLGAHATATLGLGRVQVGNLRPLSSVGNARTPWQFDVIAQGASGTTTVPAVLLVQATAGQLEADLGSEYAVISALHAAGIAVPRPLWCDPTGAVLGVPSIVTEFVEGTADHGLLHRTDDDATAVITDLAGALAHIHGLDPATLGSAWPPAATAGQSIALTQVERWHDVFVRHRLEPMPAMVYGFDWLRRHAPDDDRTSLVHGDFRVGNFLAHDRRVTAVLDWEIAHLGDPIEDIGWLYRSMWSPSGILPLDDFLTVYESVAGFPVDRRRVEYYRLFGEIKHATISLTASHSFIRGTSANLKLADRGSTVVAFLREFLTGVDRIEEAA